MPLDYINRGPDKRPLGRIGGFLQGLFSLPFSWKHTPPKKLVQIGKSAIFWPPFIAINIRQNQLWRTVRIGYRWDANYEGYIADVIIKLREEQFHL